MKFFVFSAFFLLFSMIQCKQLPEKKLSQWNMVVDVDNFEDTLVIKLENPLHCPINIDVSSKDKSFDLKLERNFPSFIDPKSDTVFIFETKKQKAELGLKVSSSFGNPTDSIEKKPFIFPVPEGKSFKIIQGYNGSFSHSSDYSRYAIDFDLKVGDTICAAADGFVVGVIEGYKHGGNNRKWRDYANFITLFHPESNLYTQYVHLIENGSLVDLGDEVRQGQPIAISGETGFVSGAHLHFNVLKAVEGGMISEPIEFENGIKGESLRKGQKVER